MDFPITNGGSFHSYVNLPGRVNRILGDFRRTTHCQGPRQLSTDLMPLNQAVSENRDAGKMVLVKMVFVMITLDLSVSGQLTFSLENLSCLLIGPSSLQMTHYL